MSPTDTPVLEAAPKTKPEFVITEPLNHNRWSLYEWRGSWLGSAC